MAKSPVEDILLKQISLNNNDYSIGQHVIWEAKKGSIICSYPDNYVGIILCAGDSVMSTTYRIAVVNSRGISFVDPITTSDHYNAPIQFCDIRNYVYLNIMCMTQDQVIPMLSIKISSLGLLASSCISFDYDCSNSVISNIVWYAASDDDKRYTWNDINGPIAIWEDLEEFIGYDKFTSPKEDVIAMDDEHTRWRSNITGTNRFQFEINRDCGTQNYVANQAIRYADLTENWTNERI